MFARHRSYGHLAILALVFVSLLGCGSSKRAQSLLEKGKKQLFDGNRKGAISTLSDAIKADPGLQEAYVFRGMCYNESNQPKKALKDFTQAIELKPNDSYAYEQRALIYRNQLNDQAKAAADSKKAAELREGVRNEQRERYNAAR